MMSSIFSSTTLSSPIRISAIKTVAAGTLGYVGGILATKICLISPAFPIVVAISLAATIALNSAIQIAAEINTNEYRLQKYQIHLFEAAGYVLMGAATLVACIAFNILGVWKVAAMGGQIGPLCMNLYEAYQAYKIDKRERNRRESMLGN